jgi:hypothetical protein
MLFALLVVAVCIPASAFAGSEVDADGDGYTVAQNDCNDSDPQIHPGAVDYAGDSIDQDCDGSDAVPADTEITKGPSGATTDRTPKFKFIGVAGSYAITDYECKIDDGDWKSCESPKTLKRQSYGKHTFQAMAIDTYSAPDPDPATRQFKVVHK